MRWRNRLSSIGVTALGLVLFFGIAAARVSKAQGSMAAKEQLTEAQVIALQNRFQDATVAGDAATVASLMADNVLFVHANGLVQGKAEYVDSISSGKMKIAVYTLNDAKVVFFNGGAIVCGQTDISPATAPGAEPHTLHMRISTVWVARPSGWQLILNQGTTLPAPPAAGTH